MAGVYIHIPYCRSFCIYCDFYSEVDCKANVNKDNYIDALIREAESQKEFFNREGITTLYLGGGTPSLLSIEQLERLCSNIQRIFGKPKEFTIEVNPDDINLEYAKGLMEIGVNRVSMGVQSFDNESLKWMRRRHSSQEAIAAYHALRYAGFDNISLDLIFGYNITSENESMQRWNNDLDTIIKLHPEHISSYQMSIEPGSSLCEIAEGKIKGREYQEPSQDFCASQYSLLQKRLSEAGYLQYEISNFALQGKHSRHNSSYWNREPYLGLGAAAHSFCKRERSWNVSNICSYINGVSRECEELTDEQIFEERIMLGLRGIEGVVLNPDEERLLCKKANELTKKGLLVYNQNSHSIRIPSEKLFISDFIIVELLS